MTDLLKKLVAIAGEAHVLTDCTNTRWQTDWTGEFVSSPLAVVRPATTHEISALLRLANDLQVPVVPVSGNTGMVGGASGSECILLSLDRLYRILDINTDAMTVTVEAGVILSAIHEAVAAHELIFPLTFGARGSAMIGGCLSTNAGGSNVLRYGNARDLCLGLEAVLPNGEVMNVLSNLHKDNSGYSLKHLLIGAEGTLGVITKAVLKLKPKPLVYATALVGLERLSGALKLLNQLQTASGSSVEAFEFMPRAYVEQFQSLFPDRHLPMQQVCDVNILLEIGAVSPRDATPDESGEIPAARQLEENLARMLLTGEITDAVVASSESQRAGMWALREAAAELAFSQGDPVDHDIAVPLDKVDIFLDNMSRHLARIDEGATTNVVAHLGDGNIHFCVYPTDLSKPHKQRITETVEDEVLKLGGSFSAEHGIGLKKLGSMQRRKDPVALQTMRTIKTALDPNNILNPGKLIPTTG